MNDYALAIDNTTVVIQHRARNFRNLVVALVMIGATSLIGALAIRSPAPLALFLMIPPACGWFFWSDARALNRWRAEILGRWHAGTIDLVALSTALQAIPKLPGPTLSSMLRTLPVAAGLAAEQQVTNVTRRAVALVVEAIGDCHADALAWRTAAATFAALLLVIAAFAGQAGPLLWIAAAIAAPMVAAWRRQRRLRQTHRAVSPIGRDSEFQRELYQRFLESADWTGIPVQEKRRLSEPD